MRRLIGLATALCLLAAAAPASANSPAWFSGQWLATHAVTDAPDLTASEAIVVDRDTQQIMLAKNAEGRRPPASMMKIVTAMVALDQAAPSQPVTITPQASGMEPAVMGLATGEVLTVQDLLYGLLLDSGNDAAEALATGLPGGRASFIARMNDKAASLGLRDTHFVDPTGLDDANYTTPADMAVLADAALTGYPTIRQIVATKQIDLPATANHTAFGPTNLNDLLWTYAGTYGVKVGFTDAAGYTITLAGSRDGHNVLIVLMGSQDHFADGRKLFDWAYAHIPAPDGVPVRQFAADVEPQT